MYAGGGSVWVPLAQVDNGRVCCYRGKGHPNILIQSLYSLGMCTLKRRHCMGCGRKLTQCSL
uniref:Uncharacterized protein n=1 Tax=Anguilla anguilla TaxID=7936 RepID=A0A0E9VXC5_ANGAN